MAVALVAVLVPRAIANGEGTDVLDFDVAWDDESIGAESQVAGNNSGGSSANGEPDVPVGEEAGQRGDPGTARLSPPPRLAARSVRSWLS
ncbi:MAG TPA: hypothetical protein VKG45_08020 [Actinomycetes bacterium]|nr:hypothetical protein [Actinomycetes bacterium]